MVFNVRNIVIVEAISTGYNFVEDAVRRGYNPIVLEYETEGSDDYDSVRKESHENYYRQPTIIKINGDYDRTLKIVRELDPVLVVAGSELGVNTAVHLADDLGLPGNSYANIKAITLKDHMHEALKKAGIRYIKGQVVSTVEQAVAFCKENGLEQAVVKPLESAGSMGMYLCDNIDDVKNAVSSLLKSKSMYGFDIDAALVQERIIGEEYIVNTVSCNGVHKLNSILRYNKIKTEEGGYIYDYIETLSRLESEHTAMVEYAYKVADAIGVRYGMIHGEYMIDKNGPVLIEVNCRPMGCTMTDEYLDLIYGQHESDTTIDAYLDPEGFTASLNKPYKPLRKGVLKLIMVPKDLEAEDHPILEVAKHLRSTYRISSSLSDDPVRYIKTRDLESAGGVVYLVHDDENVVKSDLELLRKIEKKYFSFLLSEGMSRRWFTEAAVGSPDVGKIRRECGCYGAVLYAGDKPQEIQGIQCVCPETLSDAHKGFDNVIIGYQESLVKLNETKCLRLIFETIDKVKPGGRVIIPSSTYEYLSYKREGAELLLEVKGLSIEPPVQGINDYVIGLKER